jgi:hypothetical protein
LELLGENRFLCLGLCQTLKKAGVIPGGDMTIEAALAKLSYVLGKIEWSMEMKKEVRFSVFHFLPCSSSWGK